MTYIGDRLKNMKKCGNMKMNIGSNENGCTIATCRRKGYQFDAGQYGKNILNDLRKGVRCLIIFS